MEIGNIRQSLEECAGHYEKFEEAYIGPIAQNVIVGNEHLDAAAVAIKQAMEEAELARAAFSRAEASAIYASLEARKAESIANSGIGNQSADLFISNLLPGQSRMLSDISQQVSSTLVRTQARLDGRSGSTRGNLRKALQAVEGSKEEVETQGGLIQENGHSAGEWAVRIRSYLNRM